MYIFVYITQYYCCAAWSQGLASGGPRDGQGRIDGDVRQVPRWAWWLRRDGGWSRYIYTNLYLYTYIFMYIHLDIYSYVYPYACVYIYEYIYIYTCVYIYLYICKHIYNIHTDMYVYIYIYLYVCRCMYLHIYI